MPDGRIKGPVRRVSVPIDIWEKIRQDIGPGGNMTHTVLSRITNGQHCPGCFAPIRPQQFTEGAIGAWALVNLDGTIHACSVKGLGPDAPPT